eukprot:scaffold232167_cov30-Tisochrysis_lutea.AAC.1
MADALLDANLDRQIHPADGTKRSHASYALRIRAPLNEQLEQHVGQVQCTLKGVQMVRRPRSSFSRPLTAALDCGWKAALVPEESPAHVRASQSHALAPRVAGNTAPGSAPPGRHAAAGAVLTLGQPLPCDVGPAARAVAPAPTSHQCRPGRARVGCHQVELQRFLLLPLLLVDHAERLIWVGQPWAESHDLEQQRDGVLEVSHSVEHVGLAELARNV